MYTQNEYVSIQINKDAYNDAYREAEKLRELRRAGLLKPSRMTCMICRGAASFGRLLIAVGTRLANLRAAQPMGAD
jgi:hypothetical protein